MNFDIDPREINLQGPDGMQLVKLLRGLIAAIESGGDEPEPGDDSEFFYCTYGTTTYSEIQNALAEDKVPICIRNGLYYYLVNTTQNRYVFACYNPTNNYIYAVRCLTDRWDNVTFMIQERLTWDYTPTQGSTRPVTSGGVWTALQNAGGSDIDPYQQYPEMDGVASPGNSDDYARGNHVHPTDTSRAAASEITRIDAALATKADAATMEQDIEDAVDDWLTSQAPSIGTLSYAAKRALLNLLQHVAYDHATDIQYYNALESELFPDATLESITAVFNQGQNTVWSDDSLDTLNQYLTVTAYFSDQTSAIVTGYTLQGTLDSATSTITVLYNGKTTTFTVAVTLVGSTNYAGSLSNWTLTTTPTAAYSNGVITFKYQTTSSFNNNNYSMWGFDCKETLWSAVSGKKLRIRVTEYSPDWTGNYSDTTPNNRAIDGIAIFENANITSGGGRQKYASLGGKALTSTPQTFEYVIDAELSSFTGGTGTPTAQSTFGYSMYNASMNTVIVTDLQIVEVLN